MSSADTLTYDMSQMTDKAPPSVFVKRDWLSILDSQNGNYNGNQLVIDTSQLSNSNKYMSYRQAYLSVPMVMAVTSVIDASGQALLAGANAAELNAATRAFGLKSWYGSIIHSMVLDYAGTTIVQQTALCGMWNMFTLMTSLSVLDIELNGSTLGFFPDDVNWSYNSGPTSSGIGTCNNRIQTLQGDINFGLGGSEFSNPGLWQRMVKTVIDPTQVAGQQGEAIEDIVSTNTLNAYYRSLVTKSAASATPGATLCILYSIQAQIFLKHVHSFFANCPLMKGVFFRLTLNLNQPVVVLQEDAGGLTCQSITSPLGGVSPIMVVSQQSDLKSSAQVANVPGQAGLNLSGFTPGTTPTARITLNVGNTIIDPTQRTKVTAAGVSTTTSLNASCQLYIPAYTFNPSYEEAYLSRPTKTIQYRDIYQFTTAETSGAFNYLITNGISNVKSVLVLPFFSQIESSLNYPPYQSPFDPAGAGPTSPLTSVITNFNVVVAGQNMIYNTQNYGFEEFINQFVGVNSINGNQTDGLTSGLISFDKWNSSYGYWYVDTSRMLPVDEPVPKSISIQGTTQQNTGTVGKLKFYVFVEYGVQISLDVLTGARV